MKTLNLHLTNHVSGGIFPLYALPLTPGQQVMLAVTASAQGTNALLEYAENNELVPEIVQSSNVYQFILKPSIRVASQAAGMIFGNQLTGITIQ